MSWSSGPARRRGARDKARNSMDLVWNSIPSRTVATGFGSTSLRGESERRPNAQVRVGPRSIETRLIITRGNCQSVLVVLASARLRGLDVASRYHYPPRPRKIPFMTPSRVAIARVVGARAVDWYPERRKRSVPGLELRLALDGAR